MIDAQHMKLRPTTSRTSTKNNVMRGCPNDRSRRPTASCILAQGKPASAVAALGVRLKPDRRLKACCISHRVADVMRQAFSLRTHIAPQPRALPWASMREPVGLEEGDAGFDGEPVGLEEAVGCVS